MTDLRGELIEGVITEARTRARGQVPVRREIDPKVLIGTGKAVARGSFYPVLVASAPQKIGMLELLEVMTEAFPPRRAPAAVGHHAGRQACHGPVLRPQGPLLAEVVKTTSDSYVGGSAWSGCSPAPCARMPPCTCPDTAAPPAGTRTTTTTSGSAR
jgi:elongation factor G